MKKKILYLLLVLCLMLTVVGVTVACGNDSGCDHAWEAATCTKAKTCSKCGATEGSADPSAHTYGAWVTLKQPNCTETGLNSHTCIGCGAVENVTIPTEHTYGEVEVINRVTCEDNGLLQKTCTICKHVEQEIVPATGHTFGSWEITLYATCIDEGEQQKYCDCGETLIETIPAKGHVDKNNDDKCDTCQKTMPGACECVAFETVNKVVIKPSCTEDGEGATIERCIECGKEKSRTTYVIQATGHNETVIPAIPVTCTTDGSTEGVRCSVCKEVLKQPESIKAEGHSYGDWKTVKGATCTEDGEKQRVCAVCNNLETEKIPAKGHEEVVTEAVKATCTSVGYTEGTNCSVCGEVIKAIAEVPMTPHSYGEWIILNPASCTENGKEQRFCSVCHANESKEIIAIGHNIVTIPAKPATCTTNGSTEGKFCSSCAEVFTEAQVIPAAGHTEEIIPGKEPTCLEAGKTEGVVCSSCGEVLKPVETIPAPDHDIVFIPAKEATCITAGHTYGMQCTACQKYFEEPKTIPATGLHLDEDSDKKCDSCGKDMIPAVETKTPVITVESITAMAGESIVVYINIANNPGVACGELTITYGAGLKLTKVELGNAFDGIDYTKPATLESGKCKLIWDSIDTVGDGDGAIVSLMFDIDPLAAGKINVSVSGVLSDIDLEDIDVEIVNGFVTVSGTEVCNHEVEIIPAIAATCTSDGSTAGAKCVLCDVTLVKSEVIPALGHKETIIPAKAPTCVDDGYSEGVMCETCGEILVSPDIDFATGHTTEIILGTPATCITAGYTDGLKCTICDMILEERERIPAKGHIPEIIPEVPATCYSSGYTEGSRCSECNIILEAPKVIPALEHKYGESYIESYATCTENGVMKQVCHNCGNAKTEIIRATGHKNITIPGVDATCTGTGYTERVQCYDCGVIFEASTTIPAKGHKEVIIPAEKATCTSEGRTAGVRCSDCGTVIRESKPLPAKGHNYGEWIITEAATCTNNGSMQQSCYECGAVNRESIPATGHNIINGTCTSCGWTLDLKADAIADKLTGVSISEILAEIKDRYEGAPTLNINALLEQLNIYADVPAAKTAVSVNGGYITMTDENGNKYIGLKDGYLVYANDKEIVDYEQVLPEGLGQLEGDLDQTIAMIEEMVDYITGLNYIPTVEAEDLVSVGGWYYFTDSYIEELAKGIMYVAYVMSEEAELTAEIKAQLDARIEAILSEFDLSIALAMDEDKINGVFLSVGINNSELLDMAGSMQITVEMKLSSDASRFDYVTALVKVKDNEENLNAEILLNSKAYYNGDGSCTVANQFDVNVAEDGRSYIYNFRAGIGFDATGIPVSVEFNADMSSNYNYLGSMSFNNEYGWAYVAAVSDSHITMSLNADLTGIKEGNANASFSINMSATNPRLVVESHSDNLTDAMALSMLDEEQKSHLLDIYDENGKIEIKLTAAANVGLISITYTDADGLSETVNVNVEINSEKATLPPDAVIELIQGFVPTPECQHVWMSGSCTTPSYCTKCGQMMSPPMGHDFQNGYCVRCGISDGKIPHEHTYELLFSKEATCTEKGEVVMVCIECKIEMRETIPAIGHKFDGGYCVVCKAPEGDIEVPHEHKFETIEMTVPTCTEDGRRVYECVECKMQFVETHPATGHSPNEDGTCNWCGEPLHQHEFYEVSRNEPTCLVDGAAVYECSCGIKMTNVIHATNHYYMDGVCTVCSAEATPEGIVADQINNIPLFEVIEEIKQYTNIDIATMLSDINLYIDVPANNTVISVKNGYITVKDEYGDTYVGFKGAHAVYVNQDGTGSEPLLPTEKVAGALENLGMYAAYILDLGYLPTVNENDISFDGQMYCFNSAYIKEFMAGVVYTVYTMTEDAVSDDIKAQLEDGIDMLVSEIDFNIGFFKDADLVNGIIANITIDDTTIVFDAAGSFLFEIEVHLSDDLTKIESVRACMNMNDVENNSKVMANASADFTYTEDGTIEIALDAVVEQSVNGENMYFGINSGVAFDSTGVLKKIEVNCNYSNSAEKIDGHGTGGNGWDATVWSVANLNVNVYLNVDISDIKNGYAIGTLQIESKADNERLMSEIRVHDPIYATGVPTEEDLIASIDEVRKQEMLDSYHENFKEVYDIEIVDNVGTLYMSHKDADGQTENITVNVELNSDKTELPPDEIIDIIQNYVPGTDNEGGNDILKTSYAEIRDKMMNCADGERFVVDEATGEDVDEMSSSIGCKIVSGCNIMSCDYKYCAYVIECASQEDLKVFVDLIEKDLAGATDLDFSIITFGNCVLYGNTEMVDYVLGKGPAPEVDNNGGNEEIPSNGKFEMVVNAVEQLCSGNSDYLYEILTGEEAYNQYAANRSVIVNSNNGSEIFMFLEFSDAQTAALFADMMNKEFANQNIGSDQILCDCDGIYVLITTYGIYEEIDAIINGDSKNSLYFPEGTNATFISAIELAVMYSKGGENDVMYIPEEKAGIPEGCNIVVFYMYFPTDANGAAQIFQAADEESYKILYDICLESATKNEMAVLELGDNVIVFGNSEIVEIFA